jgi:hypothetical protein
MGGFYDSIHVRSESYQSIQDILNRLAKDEEYKFYLAPVINGWVSLFASEYGQESLSREISRQTEADVLHMMVHDDDVFCYLYYRGSKLIDEYNSCPGYFGEKVPAKERKRLKGRPEVFRELVGTQSKVNKIRKILKSKSICDKIKIPREIKQQARKLESLSKSLDEMMHNQEAMTDFIENHPELLKDKLGPLVNEAMSQGLNSEDELRGFLEKDKQAKNIMMKIAEEYAKSCVSSEEFESLRPDSNKLDEAFADMQKQISDEMVGDEKGNLKATGLFASEIMTDFAEVLGIANVLTSYQYLKAGGTDGVRQWKRFVEIA